MGWEIAPARSAFPPFAAEWDRLNAELYGSHPFFDSRFVAPLLEFFGKDSEQLCVHRTSTRVDGALIVRPLGMGRWELFVPSQSQAGPVLLRDAGLLETLMTRLPGYACAIDLLKLDPQFSPNWSGLRRPRTVLAHALTMAVGLDGSFEDYWQRRPKQLRKNLARYQARARHQPGAPSFVTIADPQQIRAALARYGALETSGWKGQAGTAVGIDNAQGQFYEKVLEGFADSGQARVAELYIGEKLVASRLIVLHAEMWIILKTTYDESFAAMAPGRQLLYEVLRRAFLETPSGTVEFYTDATRDQGEWATSLRYIVHHQLYRNEMVAALFGLAKAMHASLYRQESVAIEGNAKYFTPVDVKTYQSIPDLSPEAIRLFQDHGRRNVESSPGWFNNLQQAVFAGDPGIRYYVTELAGVPSAILPLRLTRQGPLREVESLANYYTSLYSPILAPGGTALDLLPLLKQADRDHGGAHVMRFSPMDPDSAAYEALLTALRTCGWVPFRFFHFGNWFLKVDGTWSEYLRTRDGRLRSTIRRMGRKFVADGGTLEIVTDPALIEPAIQAFNHVYAFSWKKPEPYPAFVPGLVRWLAAKGALRLGIARLAGRPVAAQVWIVSHGKADIFKLAYDEACSRFSPGTLLSAHLMEHVIDRDGVKEVDYLIGDDEYKHSWMSHRRERWGIVAYKPTTLSGLALVIQEIASRNIQKAAQITRSRLAMPAQAMHWEIVPISRFGEYAARWDALQRSCARVPFLESAFLLPLLDEFATGHEVLALGKQQGKLCAAAIMTKTRFGLWQTFQPSQLPLSAWLSAQNANISDIGKSLIRSLPGIKLSIGITQVDPMFQRRPIDGARFRTLDYISTAWVEIDKPFDTYWEARGKNLKSNMRKQRTKLQAEGVLATLECITRPQDVALAIQEYGVLESAGWKGEGGTAVHPSNAQGRFYRKMLEKFCALGRGRIYRYRFNDKVVAMDLCVENAEQIVILKTTYDQSYKTVSPSTLMRQDQFRELFAEGRLKRIEFYGKLMEWHTRWTDNARTLYHSTVYRSGLLASMHGQWMETRKRHHFETQAAASRAE